MESLTKELVSNESAQLFPDDKRSSFANFLLEQLNLECQWQVANSETLIKVPKFQKGKFHIF